MDSSTKTLIIAVAVLVVLVGAAYAFRSPSGDAAGGGSGGGSVCAAAGAPAVGAGLRCAPARGGAFAWYTAATPGDPGVAFAASAANPVNKTWTASVADCVTEEQCQTNCLSDSGCALYTYDMAGAPSTPCAADGSCPSGSSCLSSCPAGDKCSGGVCASSGTPCSSVCVPTACPVAGSVCTTYGGAVPTALAAGKAYTTAGVPAARLGGSS